MKNILKKLLVPVFEIYAIELLGSMSLTYREYACTHLYASLNITIVMGSQRS